MTTWQQLGDALAHEFIVSEHNDQSIQALARFGDGRSQILVALNLSQLDPPLVALQSPVCRIDQCLPGKVLSEAITIPYGVKIVNDHYVLFNSIDLRGSDSSSIARMAFDLAGSADELEIRIVGSDEH